MKILTLTCEYPPIGGGGGRVAQGLAEALVQGGHEVTLMTMGFGEHRGRSDHNGVVVHRVPCLRRAEHSSGPHELASYVMVSLVQALRLIRRERFDLIHAHFIIPDGAVAAVAARAAGVPLVLTAHGSDVPGYNPRRFKFLHPVLGPFWRRIVASAATVVSPSHLLSGLIEARAPIAVEVIPNGLSASFASASEPKENRVLAVSRLVGRKALDVLIEAWPSGSDYALDIVGDGPERANLERLAKQRGVPAEFHGWQERESPAMRRLYERARIFVLPSEAENFPVVLLEALAAGLAVVTTTGTGSPEVVGDAGVLVPPRDVDALSEALRSLMSDPDRTRQLGRAARQRLDRHFTWDVVAKEYLEVYRAALDQESVDSTQRLPSARAG